MDPVERQRLRQISRALFNNSSRLEVALYLGEHVGRLVYAREISRSLALNDPDVTDNLRRFADAGLLEDQGRPAVGVPNYFMVLRSRFWELAALLRKEAARTQRSAAHPKAAQP
jgi:DNA-binding MarR family transcriptional regulator